MIVSLFLATCLPFLAQSLFHRGQQPLSFLENFPPQLPSALEALPAPQPSQFFTLQQRKPTKLFHLDKGKRNFNGNTQGRTGQVSAASPSNTNAGQLVIRQNQDFYLEEQVEAPSGTQIIWYKDGNPLQRQRSDCSTTGSTTESSIEVPASSASSRLLVVSGVFIDCARAADAGIYQLQVRTPGNGPIFHRNFTVTVIDWWGRDGQSCEFTEPERQYLPRIYQYAIYARANVGDSIVLPCHFQGLSVRRAWYRNNNRILGEDSNHQMLSNGDLLIRQLSADSGPVEYACLIRSCEDRHLTDLVRTGVYSIDSSITSFTN